MNFYVAMLLVGGQFDTLFYTSLSVGTILIKTAGRMLKPWRRGVLVWVTVVICMIYTLINIQVSLSVCRYDPDKDS